MSLIAKDDNTAERDRWPLIAQCFAAALDTPPTERDLMLANAGADTVVRDAVRRLLARHESLSLSDDASGAFLGRLDPDNAARLLDEPIDDAMPTAIDRFEVVRELGRGSSGIVYLARDPTLGRRVAVKLLSPWLSANATSARRFRNEARAASVLDHPRIATVYDIGSTDDNQMFIVMAYREGVTLRERIAQSAVPFTEAVTIAVAITDGLSAAHAHGIVHRDVKPENILLTEHGACILDFGIAKLEGEAITLPGSALGTAAYMSPEQSQGLAVDQRSDIWSLGVVLYEMLFGVRPFTGARADVLIRSIREESPASLSPHNADVPSQLMTVVLRALEKSASRRFQTAAEMRGALIAT